MFQQVANAQDQLFQHGWQPELVGVGDLIGDGADHPGHMGLLDVDIDPKARDLRHHNREVGFHLAVELDALTVVHDRTSQHPRDLRVQLLLRQRSQRAVGLHRGRGARGNEQVRAARLRHGRQQLVHVGHRLIVSEHRQLGIPSVTRSLALGRRSLVAGDGRL